MSPTVFKVKNFRFFFYAREEKRMHVHVESPHGEAKFWIEPVVALSMSRGFSNKELVEIKNIVESKQNEIKKIWNAFFQ